MEHDLRRLPRTYALEATVAADGSLIPPSSAVLPLKVGEKVSVIISRLPLNVDEDSRSLEGTVLRYDDPLGPATNLDDWDVLT